VKNLCCIDAVQPRYNLLFRSLERDLLPLCAEEAIAVIPYNRLAGRSLSGKHDRTAAPATAISVAGARSISVRGNAGSPSRPRSSIARSDP
jgi:aryl-alcohol dehydrogenase-like predicted oxidoreductase